MREVFIDDLVAFGWVIEKGQAPGIHFMQPDDWHQLHSPARNIQTAEWVALIPQKLHRSPLAAQLLCREFMRRPPPCNVAAAATKVNWVKGPEFSLETQRSIRR